MKIFAFVDGAYIRNTGEASAGGVILASQEAHLFGEYYNINMTNNRAELSAIYKALILLCSLGIKKDITLYSDSEYSIEVINGNYFAKTNLSLIKDIKTFKKKNFEQIKVRFCKCEHPLHQFVDGYVKKILAIPGYKYQERFSMEEFLAKGKAFLP